MRMIEVVAGSGHWVNPASVDSIESLINSHTGTPYTEIRYRDGRRNTTFQSTEECLSRVNDGLQT